jgi:hypothetical protein
LKKRFLAILMLLIAMPTIANAWFFSTQVKNAGGSIRKLPLEIDT